MDNFLSRAGSIDTTYIFGGEVSHGNEVAKKKDKKPAAKKASTKAKTVKPVFQIITLADNGSDIVESEVRGDRVAALKAIAEAKAGSLSGAEVVISVTNGEAVSIFTYIGGKRVE